MTDVAVLALTALLSATVAGGAPARAALRAPDPAPDTASKLQAPQSLARRVAAVGTGIARIRFATDPDVCGNGERYVGRLSSLNSGRWAECRHGPARVALTVRRGRVTGLTLRVAGHWPPAGPGVTDLGRVAGPAAAHYLLGLVPELPDRHEAGRAMAAAVIADSARVGDSLDRLARDGRLGTGVRKSAIFWLGESGAPVKRLDALYSSIHGRALKGQVIFALSQSRGPGALDALVHIARHATDRALRRKAVFWLGQSRDPRALDTLRAMILGPSS